MQHRRQAVSGVLGGYAWRSVEGIFSQGGLAPVISNPAW